MGKVLDMDEAFKNHLLPPARPAGSVLMNESLMNESPGSGRRRYLPTALWSHAETWRSCSLRLSPVSADRSPAGE